MDNLNIKDLDHLGIVAGIIDEMGLVEIINEEVGTHPQEKLSVGTIVKAMILNCLGCINAPLYLFSEFFKGKALEHLLGEGIKAEDLNDDKLGRSLDRIFGVGVTNLFTKIALKATAIFGIKKSSKHLDSTSISVEGKYKERIEDEEDEKTKAIKIKFGYSRDKRPDLKQFMLNMICSGDGGVPLFMQLGDGNESDKKVFPQIIKDCQETLQMDSLSVMDGAFYTAENVSMARSIQWLSRVPLTLKEATETLENTAEDQWQQGEQDGYRWQVRTSEYGGEPQRWLVVESAQRLQSDHQAIAQKIEQADKVVKKEWQTLCGQNFACEADALIQAQLWQKGLTYHQLSQVEVQAIPYYAKGGRPKQGTTPLGFHYRLTGQLSLDSSYLKTASKRAGRFILATNVLDSQILSPDQMLAEYKAQQNTERGFRFLKDPFFFASALFLKNPQRIMALMMIMVVSLLVYTLAQRRLRQALALAHQTIPNQKGKPTATPTLRWVFQSFLFIRWLEIDGIKTIVNLTSNHKHILSFLGSSCQKYYFIS
ncbi:MAG: IS1634 family transposase [Microcystaceae cyanobacterium]